MSLISSISGLVFKTLKNIEHFQQMENRAFFFCSFGCYNYY